MQQSLRCIILYYDECTASLTVFSHHLYSQVSSITKCAREFTATSGYAYFKFEPFILHAMCKSLGAAQTLVRWPLGAQGTELWRVRCYGHWCSFAASSGSGEWISQLRYHVWQKGEDHVGERSCFKPPINVMPPQ